MAPSAENGGFVPVVFEMKKWCSHGESNPGFRRERATSWTARRWERGAGGYYSRGYSEYNTGP